MAANSYGTSKLEDQVQALTSMVQELMKKEKNTRYAKACGICSSNHSTFVLVCRRKRVKR